MNAGNFANFLQHVYERFWIKGPDSETATLRIEGHIRSLSDRKLKKYYNDCVGKKEKLFSVMQRTSDLLEGKREQCVSILFAAVINEMHKKQEVIHDHEPIADH